MTPFSPDKTESNTSTHSPGKAEENGLTHSGDQRGIDPGPEEFSWCNDLKRARQSGPSLFDQPSAEWSDATLCVHAGTGDDPATGAIGTPIYQTSTFRLEKQQYQSVEHGSAREHFIYTRYGNPNQWAVQNKIAALENAESALVFSSGMAAITATVLGLVDKGGHVVASSDLYGGTYNLFNQSLPSLGMSASYANPRDLEAIEAAIKPNTQVLFFESVSNPLLKVLDIEGLVRIAKKYGLRTVVDATFSTPLGLKALDMGVDVVVHSASKYLGGHSDLIAGAAAGSRKLIDRVWGSLLVLGGSMDPHACFLLERGLKTLSLRMRAHQENALKLAQALEQHPKIKKVFHPALDSHPDQSVAKGLLRNFGGMVTFVLEGGDEASLRLLDKLRIPKIATSLGGVESLVSLPFNTSHASFTAHQRSERGIDPGCVRYSCGVEDSQDLIADLFQALSQI